MKQITFVLAAALLLALGANAQNSSFQSFTGFTSVGVGGGFDKVIFRKGDKEGVEIKSDKVDLDNIEIKQKGKDLNIGVRKGARWNSGRIELVITYQKLESISNSGSSNIELEDTIKGDKFTLASSGSGSLKGNFDVEEFDVRLSGSTNLTLSGEADDQHYAISGSANVNAAGLKGETAEVAISGSCDVSLNVSGNVSTAVSGSGSVHNKAKKNRE